MVNRNRRAELKNMIIKVNLKCFYYREEERKVLSKNDPVALSSDGDVLGTDYHNLLFSIAPQDNRSQVECFARGTFGVPSFLITSFHLWLKCIGTVWKYST